MVFLCFKASYFLILFEYRKNGWEGGYKQKTNIQNLYRQTNIQHLYRQTNIRNPIGNSSFTRFSIFHSYMYLAIDIPSIRFNWCSILLLVVCWSFCFVVALFRRGKGRGERGKGARKTILTMVGKMFGKEPGGGTGTISLCAGVPIQS